MTSRRYAHYRRALRWIGSLNGADVDARSIETLRGSVQDLLLSREVSTDTVEVEQRAALALTRMTLAGVLSRTAADEIWRAICATGPRDALMSAESGVLTASRS